MDPTLIVLIETACLFALTVLILFTLLAFRNPHRPGWLRTDFTESVAVSGLLTVTAFIWTFHISGLLDAGVSIFVAPVITPIIVLIFGFVVWRLFGIGERLARTRKGQSPFRQARFAAASGAPPLKS
jgi:hypothetical protein